MGQGQTGQGQMGQMGQAAMTQEALRRALGELMASLGEAGMPIPRALGEAELSMRAARDALQQGQPGEALDPEAQAIDQLQQGGQAMMQEMQRMYGQGQGQMPGQQFGQSPEQPRSARPLALQPGRRRPLRRAGADRPRPRPCPRDHGGAAAARHAAQPAEPRSWTTCSGCCAGSEPRRLSAGRRRTRTRARRARRSTR